MLEIDSNRYKGNNSEPLSLPCEAVDEVADRCFGLILDEIDYGVVVIGADGSVAYTNHAARAEMRESRLIAVLDGVLRLSNPADMATLTDAIRAACRQGFRRLILLGEGRRRLNLAVVPLSARVNDEPSPVLLLLGKQSMCEKLTTHWYAVSHGLTPAEQAVLERLSEGQDPGDIALSHRVAISTIRTQIASLRLKAGVSSIGGLLRQVALLPPVLTSLRSLPTGPAA
jgi:DNA-binding CsgD family transcriptional regulator